MNQPATMDLEILLQLEREASLSSNGTGGGVGDHAGGLKYLEEHVGVMVPYFAMLLLACIFGTFGNILIISAILTLKVRTRGPCFL